MWDFKHFIRQIKNLRHLFINLLSCTRPTQNL